MMYISQIVKKWREHTPEETKEARDVSLEEQTKNVIKTLSLSYESERDELRKKISNIIEQLENISNLQASLLNQQAQKTFVTKDEVPYDRKNVSRKEKENVVSKEVDVELQEGKKDFEEVVHPIKDQKIPSKIDNIPEKADDLTNEEREFTSGLFEETGNNKPKHVKNMEPISNPLPNHNSLSTYNPDLERFPNNEIQKEPEQETRPLPKNGQRSYSQRPPAQSKVPPPPRADVIAKEGNASHWEEEENSLNLESFLKTMCGKNNNNHTPRNSDRNSENSGNKEHPKRPRRNDNDRRQRERPQNKNGGEKTSGEQKTGEQKKKHYKWV